MDEARFLLVCGGLFEPWYAARPEARAAASAEEPVAPATPTSEDTKPNDKYFAKTKTVRTLPPNKKPKVAHTKEAAKLLM
jgi:hypothetical protein